MLPFLFLLLALATAIPAQIEDNPVYDEGTPVEGPVLPRFRLNVEGGYSYRTANAAASATSDEKKAADDLKGGSNFTGDFSYYLSRKYGICFHYSRSMASSTVSSGTQDVTVSFYSAGLAERSVFAGGNVVFVGNILVGRADFNDKLSAGTARMTITGKTFGFSGMLGFDFMLNENLALGFDISYLLATVREVEANGVSISLDPGEGLNRFDFNGGIKYYW